MLLSRRELLLAAAFAPAVAQAGRLAPVKIATIPFGTVSWEVETIRHANLDVANAIRLEPVKLANNDATRIAFQAGQVDTIVTDLLWAARLRNDGRKVKFLPFSATEGAVMVPADSPIRTIADLTGKRIGVSGGALDKSWLMLRAHARQTTGVDLATGSAPSYGASPLLMNKLASGELDAALLYWNFCARLEAKGFRRLVGAGDIARAFGIEGNIALIGYIFDEAILAREAGILDAFAKTSAQAKRLLATSEAAWAPVRPLMEAPDEVTYQTLKRYFLEGIPSRPVSDERQDAERLYAVLARLGGEKLVGSGTSLPPDLYWGEG
jgi:NitT/TauT family transport system substrate-binding protein